MPRIDDLNLRVEGVLCQKVTFQRAMEGGYPGGVMEIVAHDPAIGDIVLTQDCNIELQEGDGPWRQRNLNFLLWKVGKLST